MGGNKMQKQASAYVRFTFPTKAAEFFVALNNHRLLGTRCVKCRDLQCPPRIDCPRCLGSEVEWVELSGKGKLLTYTSICIAPASFAKRVPYIVGIVKLDEGPKMMAQVVDAKPEKLEIGMDVCVVFGEGFGNQPSYSFKPCY
jgi:hypothetical protein